jgi:hypothetical protein
MCYNAISIETIICCNLYPNRGLWWIVCTIVSNRCVSWVSICVIFLYLGVKLDPAGYAIIGMGGILAGLNSILSLLS